MTRRAVHHDKPTRQQRAYRELKELGLCVRCGTRSGCSATTGVHCRWCAEKLRAAARARLKRLEKETGRR